jgi:hypothetical protein
MVFEDTKEVALGAAKGDHTIKKIKAQAKIRFQKQEEYGESKNLKGTFERAEISGNFITGEEGTQGELYKNEGMDKKENGKKCIPKNNEVESAKWCSQANANEGSASTPTLKSVMADQEKFQKL